MYTCTTGNKLWLIFFLTLLLFLNNISAQIYWDSTAAVEARVSDLLGRMTLQEKVGQMTQIDLSHVKDDPAIITNYFLGSLLSGGGSSPDINTPAAWANMYDQMQQAARGTRLKIPLIYGIDAVHGHNNVEDAVIFPHNIGLGAARNAELVEQIGKITATEVAATGIDWTFAPSIAVPRDERWGRTYEGFGETTELAIELGSAFVRGFQGDTLSAPRSILACAKHFIGDGGTTGGVDQGNTQLSEAELRAIHLPGYIEAVNNDVGSIMITYSSWNGQKVHGSYYLITEVLKNELNFQGFVVSDWAAIDQLPGNYTEDVKQSINAGIDMVMVPDRYQEFTSVLIQLVNSGDVSIDRINDAVSRILRIKFMMGLFEHPFANPSLVNLVGIEAHREVARQAVRESMVLLNKKDFVLPFSNSGEKIFVAGTGGNDIGIQCGGWTISWQGMPGDITEGTTLLEAIQNRAGAANVIYDAGGFTNEEFDKAVVVIGEMPYAEGNGDSDDLTISNEDIELVKNVYAMGKPTVVILISGRPMIINPIIHHSDAIIAAWLPGTEGDGIADILFGDYQPKGKLGYSWPKYMDQIPINVGDVNYDPLFEYNYGLTSTANSVAGSAPAFYSGAANSGEEMIEISFNKPIDPNSIQECTFELFVDGTSNIFSLTPQVSPADDNTIFFTSPAAITNDQKLSLSFLSGTIRSTDGGTLQPFANKFIYNDFSESFPPFLLPGQIEAEDYHLMSGVQTEATSDIGGGLNVGWIDDGDWMRYYVSFPNRGTYQLKYRVAGLSQSGILQLKRGSNVIQSSVLPVTLGWQNWETVTTEAVMEEGEYFIELFALQGGFNINWFSFDLISEVENYEDEKHFVLEQNYPNPFNPKTSINFTLPQSGFVKIIVFNQMGEEVALLANEQMSSGTHSIDFDGSELASGIYFYQISAGEFIEAKKMVLLK